jgi:hypothetical protein
MGCDVDTYLEYNAKQKNHKKDDWVLAASNCFIERDYELFGALVDNIRGFGGGPPATGWPEELSPGMNEILEEDDLYHFGYHSHSVISYDLLATVIEEYPNKFNAPPPFYFKAIYAMATEYEKAGYQTRLLVVFNS